MSEEIVAPNSNMGTQPNRNALSLGYGDYLRFSKLLLDRAGLHFPESRHPELELGIRQAFAASTCADLDEFFTLISDHGFHASPRYMFGMFEWLRKNNYLPKEKYKEKIFKKMQKT